VGRPSRKHGATPRRTTLAGHHDRIAAGLAADGDAHGSLPACLPPADYCGRRCHRHPPGNATEHDQGQHSRRTGWTEGEQFRTLQALPQLGRVEVAKQGRR